jgi:organic hydroperoxide reductase OsmC/OhrA
MHYTLENKFKTTKTIMEHDHFYEVEVVWNEGRTGTLSSPVLTSRIECATPPEFPGGVANIWSPEHLYVAAINSCFMATFLAIASNLKLEVLTFDCKTIAKLSKASGQYQFTEADMFPVVALRYPQEDTEKALRILQTAKKGCLVTNSMKTTITLTPVIR